ncbi:hypothetical protein JR316_0001333 [Psilocybe cubensis]|uniref:Uncharacterized protein n=2 Tax=Psilocybe cubensis TaxID=181762 RepID=A0ACB8HGV7_PSICU|nr:hypothetical protein JR316_0001333 [Psilocybe cubensis]KAH9487263.1 hypothetical protein JR316_0001333 [Psilocybe cubensis]
MSITVENHPFSKLARQIEQYLWASVVLSSASATVSLINMGRLSCFVGPITFLFTLAHNFTLLALAARDRRRPPSALHGTMAPTASRAAIVLCWLLVALWSVVVLMIIIMGALIMGMGQFEGWERLAGYVELPMVVAEVFLLVVIAVKCKTQRKRSIIQPEHVDWRHVGQQQV